MKNSRVNGRMFLSLGGLICSLLIAAGCASTPEKSTVGNAQANTGDFVALSEFSKARVIHTVTETHKPEILKGACFIEDISRQPVVSAIVKRALRSFGVQVTANRSAAKYILQASLKQRHRGRRTYSTIRLAFRENNKSKTLVWTGAATVSTRGMHSPSMYAASLTGAAMYNFNQDVQSSVNRRMLNSFYERLCSVSE